MLGGAQQARHIASRPGTSFHQSEVPRLTDGVEITEHRQAEGKVVVSLPPDRFFEIAPETARLLRLIDGRRDLATLAGLMTSEGGQAITAAQLREIIQRSLVPVGLVHFGDAAVLSRGPRSTMRLRVPLIGARVVNPIARLLAPLFAPLPAATALLGVFGAHVWFYASGPRLGLAGGLLSFQVWMPVALLVLASLVIHEFGHAAALRRCGERPGRIGFGFYRASLVLFSDVSRAWRLPRLGRATVSAGGLYLQALFASGLVAAYAAHPDPVRAWAVVMIDLSLLTNLNPFRRTDGSWLAADLTGAPDLRSRALQYARALLGHRPAGGQPSPRLVVVYAWLGIAYVTTATLWLAFVAAPWLMRAWPPGSRAAAIGVALAAAVVALLDRLVRLRRRAHRHGAIPDHLEGAALASHYRLRHATLWVRSAWTVLRTRAGLRSRAGPYGMLMDLLPVSISTSFAAERTPAELRELARRYVVSYELTQLDHDDLDRGGRCHEVIHTAPLHELKRRATGVVVCSLHFGPFFYVPLELIQLGFNVCTFTTAALRRRRDVNWHRVVAGLPHRLETLPAQSPRSLIHALRRVREGDLALIYADGQAGVGATQDGRHERAEFEFLSMPVGIRTGPSYLARRAGVPVLLALTRRDGLGRRVLEFSDLLPPPHDDSHETLEAHTREMYRWLEERVRRSPEQWFGWIMPFLMWSQTGSAPRVEAEALERERQRIRRLLESGAGKAVLRADPTRVASLETRGEWVIVDGPARRIMAASALSAELLSAARRGVRLDQLRGEFDVDPATLGLEVARLTLAGLARLEDVTAR